MIKLNATKIIHDGLMGTLLKEGVLDKLCNYNFESQPFKLEKLYSEVLSCCPIELSKYAVSLYEECVERHRYLVYDYICDKFVLFELKTTSRAHNHDDRKIKSCEIYILNENKVIIENFSNRDKYVNLPNYSEWLTLNRKIIVEDASINDTKIICVSISYDNKISFSAKGFKMEDAFKLAYFSMIEKMK
jgi:hypothetical protein